MGFYSSILASFGEPRCFQHGVVAFILEPLLEIDVASAGLVKPRLSPEPCSSRFRTSPTGSHETCSSNAAVRRQLPVAQELSCGDRPRTAVNEPKHAPDCRRYQKHRPDLNGVTYHTSQGIRVMIS